MASAEPTNTYRELAYRENEGIEIVLHWHEGTNELTVSVADERSGAYFELEAEPHEALDVFYHPYSYAAFRGVPYQEALLASWAQAATAPRAGDR